MKIEANLYEMIKGEITALEHEGIIYKAESKKTVERAGVRKIQLKPKKRVYQGKRSQFQVWVRNKELGARFTEEDFYKEYPKVKKEAKAKRKVTGYISEMISQRVLVQHPKNVLEKVKE